MQASYSAASSAHSKVASGSSAAKLNEASATALGEAGPEIVVTGGIATVQAWLAGVGSIARIFRVARTRKACPPSARPSSVSGDVQGANGAPSSEHSNVASSRSDVNVNVAPVSSVGDSGRAPSVVSGVDASNATTSTGGSSVVFSRLWIVCSSPAPLSAASRRTKP